MSVPALYEREGQGFVATDTVVSPWNPKMQNGIALVGLMAHALEAQPTLAPMSFARLHIDILRPVPLGRVDVTTRIVREGRRMQMLEADLLADGEVMVRAHASRLRLAQTPSGRRTPPPVGPETLPRRANFGRTTDAPFDLRPLPGRGWEDPGPLASWLRCAAAVVRGQPVSPFVTAAMACDFGSGSSRVLPRGEYSMANIDISLNLLREPEGPWILFEAEVLTDGGGRALATTALYDLSGEFGRAHRTLFVDRLPPQTPPPPAPTRPSQTLVSRAPHAVGDAPERT